ncbi:MAG TPA: hypothetical protein VLA50_04910 [Erythrobacter sp.]|nr:hypothetical protein [Erythrobacter sp.]
MSAAALPLAMAALIPAMLGPLPAQAETITAKLCNGGMITIPVGEGGPAKDEDCHPKGCHAGTCREKDKSTKLISRKDA